MNLKLIPNDRNALMYLWSCILLCGDVESNPGPTNGNDVDINVHTTVVVDINVHTTVVFLELLFMIYQIP